MTRLLILSFALITFFPLASQFAITGQVLDEKSDALPGAIVRILEGYQHTISDSDGRYSIGDIPPGSYEIAISFLGYAESIRKVTIVAEDLNIDTQLELKPIQGPEVIVRASRATHRDPMAYAELDKVELQKRNLGMDMPELLSTMPSVHFTSDAGNGIGYTYMRLRGSDQTSINVTINGVPVNDAESQGVFWVNLPDLTASTDNVQVQRGVGTSTNGVGAFGGSVNVLTQRVANAAYAKVNIGAGSFNTQKYSLGFGTGLLDQHWIVEGRLSRISSDGYIDRSSAELRSYFLSGAYQAKKTSVSLLLFGGDELTQQAWWGVPRARLENDSEGMLAFAADNGWSTANTQNLLNSDRGFNYYTYDNEVDDYGQDHAQLHVSHALDRNWRINASVHYTKGKGFFEQFQDTENAYDDTDLSYYGVEAPVIGQDTISTADIVRRRWLDNDFYGAIVSAQYTKGKWQTVLGAGWNRYKGQHFGEVIWASIAGASNIRDRYYDNSAIKEDMNAYVKTNWRFLPKCDAYLDLQSRIIDYRFEGPSSDGLVTNQSVDYQFFNPKVGLSYSPIERHRAFVSYAVANKEPNRDDHIISTLESRPEAQRLSDLELGYSYRSQKLAVEVVVYNMQYNDQLINTGEINDVGENERTNVPSSYRRGVEFMLNARPLPLLAWSLNTTYSQNVIEDHVEFVTDYLDYGLVEQRLGDVSIAYSPQIIGSSQFTYTLIRQKTKGKGAKLDLSLISKYVSEQYLDNTETKGRTIDAYLTHDLRLDLLLHPKSLQSLRLNLLVRNLLDLEYVSNGWTYRYLYDGVESSFDALFPQAGINIMTGLSLEF